MLIAIDLQNDYLDPKGKFYIPTSATILEAIADRIQTAIDDDELIVVAKNVYPESEYAERSAEDIKWAEAIHPRFQELLKTAVIFEKEHYGIAPEEALKFKQKYHHKEHAFDAIDFVGVETNVCVLANMAIIQNIFTNSKLTISTKRTAANDPSLFDAALEVMRGLKMEVTDEV